MGEIVRLAHAAAPSDVPPASSRSGRKSSAVIAPSVTSRMREATSRPGHPGASEHRSVTYAGETPIASANFDRFIPVAASQSPSLLMGGNYSGKLKFSQDKFFSLAEWNVPAGEKTLCPMAKSESKVVPRFKAERPRHFIREWRKHRNMTQERLAALVEMSAPSISQIENGNQGYTQSTLERLAEALNCQPGDLLMRNPLVSDAPYGLLDSLKPETRRQAMVMLQALAEADKAERAA